MANQIERGERKALAKIHDDIEFRKHQLEGVREMVKRPSFMLADEMGLGKSLQSLTVAAVDYELRVAERTLIVAPATLKWNWQDEIEEHTSFSSMILHGTPKQREEQLAQFAMGGVDVLIVNYEQLSKHLGDFNRLRFDIAIFDEAHYMKNHKSKRTKACLSLRVGRAFLLTGSPMLNQVNDLWALLHRIDPDAFPNYWRFVNRYAVWGGYKDKQVVGVKNKAELNQLVARYMIRRMKSDVLDLPEKNYITIRCGLSPKQKRMYDEAKEELRISIGSEGESLDVDNAMVRMLRLKQICGTTASIDPEVDESEKLDLVTERAQEVVGNGEHLVIFTQFRSVQDCIVKRLENPPKGTDPVQCFVLNGDTPMQDRKAIVDQWSRSKPCVIVAMIQVAGVGLTMTKARTAFFVDKVWAPKINEQAEDRIHRIGASTTESVNIVSFITRGTVESRVEAVLRTKRATFDSIVSESDWKKSLYEAMLDQPEEDDEE